MITVPRTNNEVNNEHVNLVVSTITSLKPWQKKLLLISGLAMVTIGTLFLIRHLQKPSEECFKGYSFKELQSNLLQDLDRTVEQKTFNKLETCTNDLREYAEKPVKLEFTPGVTKMNSSRLETVLRKFKEGFNFCYDIYPKSEGQSVLNIFIRPYKVGKIQ